MSDLFGNTLSTLPKWMSPSEYSLASEQASASIGHNFTAAFNAAANRKQEQQQFDAMLPVRQQEAENQKLLLQSQLNTSLLNQYKTTQDLESWTRDQSTLSEWMKAHPTVESRATAQPPMLFSEKGNSVFSNARANDSASMLGMTLKSDQADFAKRLASVSAADRASIVSMQRGESGLPTKEQWEALSMAEQAAKSQTQISPQSKVLKDADREEALAEQARLAGNTIEYQKRKENAERLRSEVGKSGGGITVGMDDQNRPIVTIGGAGRPNATVGTLSKGQEKLVKYENATQLLNTLTNNLRPGDVGAAGVAGEWIADRTLSQIPGFESALNGQRVENRALLGAARESLLREISDDTRFSNKDREDIGKILPSSGVFESYGDAVKRIQTVRSILAQRARTYAERVGEPVPLFAQSKEEIRDNTRKRVAAIQSSLQAGTITKEQADAEIKREQDAALNALIKFH